MAIIKTVNFLPSIFRTETNAKFLNATLDQLVSKPNFEKINGYIGRKFSPTFVTTDNYVKEPTASRQNYQLEPSVVVKDRSTDTIEFLSTYIDLLQQIQYHGGNITNHNRLFSNESYSFDALIDYDKFVNFKNYYWVPNGPDAVDVFAGNVETEEDYTVTRNLSVNGFNFSEKGIESNPVLVLARGGTYTFKVSEPGHKFWIQTEPGLTGFRFNQTNVSTREIFGVTSNGADDGTVTFKVPLIDAQRRFTEMETVDNVDIACDFYYDQIEGVILSKFLRDNPNGIDGAKTFANLSNKSLIFVTKDDVLDDEHWTNNEFFDMLQYGVAVENRIVPENQRRDIWRVTLIPMGTVNPLTGVYDDYVIHLVPSTNVVFDQKVYVNNGIRYGTKEFYYDFDQTYHEVPVITSILDRLYYQDSQDAVFYGEIRIVDAENFTIDVEEDILGATSYTSPNGIDFTNGLKVIFNNTVTPAKYKNKQYYVEGVGKEIRLASIDDLVPIESYASNGLVSPDYITINRASYDLNGWSRSNRWFHIDVLTQTAEINKEQLIYEFTYDPNFNNEFVPIPEDQTIVSTLRSRVVIRNLEYEYAVNQIFYAYSEDNFYIKTAEGVIEPVNNYRAKNTSLPDENFRAERPILEFEHSLRLFNFGVEGLDPVNYLDFTVKDAFSDIERSGSVYSATTAYEKGSVVINDNNVYGALKNTQTLPTDSVVWKLRDQIVPFDQTRFYVKGERIAYQNHIYECLNPTQDDPANAADGIWFDVYAYTQYDPTTANTLVAGNIVEYQGFAYQARQDIQQTPGLASSSSNWELLFELENNKTIIFANEQDLEIRKRIYEIQLVTIDSVPTIHLAETSNRLLENGDVVIVKNGKNGNKNFWYDGSSWYEAQTKTGTNVAPRFDVLDWNNISYGDKTVYPNTTFNGTTIFKYKQGAGTNDTVLGFPLSYRNFNSVGDIEFETSFISDTFTFLDGLDIVSKDVNRGFLYKDYTKTSRQFRNVWIKNQETSKQYQIFSKVYDGRTNYFEIDIINNEVDKTPNLKVIVNNKLLKRVDFTLELIGARLCVVVNPSYLKAQGDKVDILIYSRDSISQQGYYEVPPNLDFNGANSDFASLSLGQLKDHIIKLEENTNAIYESVDTFTSQRDIFYKNNTGTILQHGYPLIYSNLFLTSEKLNFIESIELASREYTKFKNKFLELASSIQSIDSKTIEAHVDSIIDAINTSKNSTMPFYYSDMIPYGNNRTVYEDVVINPNLKQFDLPGVFIDTTLSNTAVLVYVNGVQLIKDRDYYFPQDRTAVIISDTFTLEADDEIRVVEYHNTDGSYLPPTPSKLGLYPKFTPGILFDDTYNTPRNVIQGHDGSIMPAFNDFRDNLILEFEKRIFNNIKINFDTSIFNLFEFIPGAFRNTEFSEAEYKRILGRSFLKWAGFNQVDFTTNNVFRSTDAWTWNYSRQSNKLLGTQLPGSPRAIYLSLFDTVRPHTHPWEMLGFANKPDWWEDRYGVAPYTGGNTLLWEELERGYIHAGPRAGIDKNFARPGLTQIIPVDEYGVRKSPDQFVVRNLNPATLNSSFEVGQMGPAEYAWIKSSDYAFSVQRALALIKPAFYFGSLMNIERYYRDDRLDQLAIRQTLKRISPKQVVVPDTTNADNSRNFVAGYLNWIVDYATNLGIDGRKLLRRYLDNLEVQLAYKVGGYTGKNYVNVLAEQSSPSSVSSSIMIPDENYDVILHKSTPVRKVVYSAVVVQKSGNGWTVTGYDLADPYFPVIPSLTDSENHVLSVGDRRATIYHNYEKRKLLVPYGTEFRNVQQVADFLVSYSRYLVGQGFVFNTLDPGLNEMRDWELSIKEFLAWEQQEWETGSLLVLSPVFDRIEINVLGGTIDAITNSVNGSKVLNPSFGVIKTNDLTVNRQPNFFSCETLNQQTICLLEARVVQYEHAMVFDNVTVFNDIVYLPALGNRQFRLKLVGNRTAGWQGELNPPGFIYNDPKVEEWAPFTDYKKGTIVKYKSLTYTALANTVGAVEFKPSEWTRFDKENQKSGLLPNFVYNVERFERIYDVENLPIGEDLQQFSAGIIGLRNRQYLSDLNLDYQSQTKFYQGFIKEKGTRNAIESLTSATFNNIKSDIGIYEEWAVRLGEYGALESDAQFEVVLDDTKFTDNPSTFNLLDTREPSTPGVTPIYPNDIYKQSTSSFVKNVFFPRDDSSDYSKDIAKAGFVNLADIDATIYNIKNFNALNTYLKQIGDSFKVWVAKDFDLDWNVYRMTSAQAQPISLNYELDDVMRIEFSKPHNLTVGEVFCIKSFNADYDGFYRVKTVSSNQSVMVDMYQGQDFLKEARTLAEDSGMLFHMDSMRLENPTQINSIAPKKGWLNGDKVWAENFDDTNRWGVYEKNATWDVTKELTASSSEYVGNDGYGASVKINRNSDLVAVGAGAYDNTGKVNIFTFLPDEGFVQTGKFEPPMIKYIYNDVSATGGSGTSAIFEVTGRRAYTSDIYYSATVVNAGTNYQLGDTLTLSAGQLNGSQAGTVSVTGVNSLGAITNFTITPNTDIGFGDVVDMSDYFMVTAAARQDPGAVIVHNFRVEENEQNKQIIPAPTPGEGFGTSVKLSDNGNWIFVGAPAANKVYVYHKKENIVKLRETITSQNVIHTAGSQYTLSFVPTSEYTITVKLDDQQVLTPIKDYTLNGAVLTIIPSIPTTSTSIEILQAPCYLYETTLTPPAGLNADAEYGAFIYCDSDASEIFVSAPSATVNGVVEAGKVFAYNRRIELQRSNALSNAYTPTTDINDVKEVYLGDTRLLEGTDWDWISSSREIIITVNRIVSEGLLQANPDTASGFDPFSSITTIPDGQRLKISSSQFDLVDEILAPEVDRVAGALFGTQTVSDLEGAAFYVTAPGYTSGSYRAGKVYRYTMRSRYLGWETATVKETTLTPGDNMYINGFRVEVSGPTVDDLINDINRSTIPGVTAFRDATGYLRIQSTSKTKRSKLFLSFANYSFGTDLGISGYTLEQDFSVPGGAQNETFGLSVSVGDEDDILLIGSGNARTNQILRVDVDRGVPTTTFDGSSTTFNDELFASNAYIYELLENSETHTRNSGTMTFAQQFDLIKGRTFDFFGLALDLRNGYIVVGDPGDDNIVNGGGTAWLFTTTGKRIWNRIRQDGDRVDIDTLSRALIYSKSSNSILTNFDSIDPAKGKVLGIAEVNLDFKSAFDPAVYTSNDSNQTNVIVDENMHWGEDQVGKIWWDLSLVRYIDYEQGSLAYRSKNWGATFPGSVIEICEWVESSVPPSEYTTVNNADMGRPKYTDEGTYVVTSIIEATTGIERKFYYYWVVDKSVTTNPEKTGSVVAIREMIESPELQGVPYLAAISRNAISVYNINDYLNGTDVALQVRYDYLRNSNTIHSEYELIQENNPNSNIPKSIINKMIDSLAGADSSGRVVPDPQLLAQDRYGISIRPRQTMFKNRSGALENFVYAINDVLIQYPIVQQKIITGLTSKDPIPAITEYDFTVDIVEELGYLDTVNLPVGYKVLVRNDSSNENMWTIYKLNGNRDFHLTRIQAFDTGLYWNYTDWYSTGFGVDTREDYTVNFERDVQSLPNVTSGQIVRVRSNNLGTFTLYKILFDNNTDDLELVGLGNGTIQLSDRLYNKTKYTLGFATENFDSERFDINPSIEIRNIFNALQDDIYIGELKEEFNKLFFTMIYWILYNQRDVDWVFKTSFVSIYHQLRELDQYPSFIRDNQDFYIDYINEVKPYRTKIREYLIGYKGNDHYQGDVTDFDLPAYYEPTTRDFRSPSGEGINDDLYLRNDREYSQWYTNQELTLESIQIAQGGTGYTVPPVVTVVNGDGTSSPVKPTAKINPVDGSVTSITFNGAFLFTSSPTIKINGNGTGAKAYPVMVNNKVRSIKTQIKFDRIAYSSNLKKWTPELDVVTGDYVYYENEIYRATQNVPASEIFDFRFLLPVSHEYGNAIDRIVAYYVAPDGTPGVDLLSKLIDGITYPGVRVTGLAYEDENQTSQLLDTNIQSIYLDTALGTRAEDINVDGGSFIDTYSSHAPQELTPGITFDTLVMSVFTRIVDQNNEIVSGPPLGYRVIHNMTGSQLIAPSSWVAELDYKHYDFVLHNGTYYMATLDIQANEDAPDTNTDWRFVWREPEAWSSTASYDKGTYITFNDVTYQAKNTFTYAGIVATVGDLVIAPANVDYTVYYVIDEDTYYYWFETSWVKVTAPDWTTKTRYERGDAVVYNGHLYTSIDGFQYVDEVADIASLPTNAIVGDVYFVTSESTYYWFNSQSTWVVTGPSPEYQTKYWTVKSVTGNFGRNPDSQTIFWSPVYLENVTSRKFSPADSRSYYRISANRSTVVTQAFSLTDTTLHVEDASVLPNPDPGRGVPGYVYVNRELIYYYEKDEANNTLGRIRRGVLGTGAAAIIPVGARVDDLSVLQTLPSNSDYTDWLNSLGEFGFVEVGDFDYDAPGFGFAYNVSYPDSPNDADTDPGDAPFDYDISITAGGVTTDQATFLGASPAYNP